MKIQIKYFSLVSIGILISASFLLYALTGCEAIYGWIVGETPYTNCKKVKVLTGWGLLDKPIFQVFGKAKFGSGNYSRREIPAFEVEKVIKLSDDDWGDQTETVWEVSTVPLGGVPRRLEIITYGINPAPDLFKETIPAKPLEIGTLYRAGYGNYVYFKIIKNPQGELVTLQGNSPDNLREER